LEIGEALVFVYGYHDKRFDQLLNPDSLADLRILHPASLRHQADKFGSSDHLPAHGANVAGNVPKLGRVAVDWKSPLNKRNVVDAADWWVRFLFPETRYRHTSLLLFPFSRLTKSGQDQENLAKRLSLELNN
jgi:hypothetical protein